MLTNIAISLVLSGLLLGAVFHWGRSSQKNKQLDEKAKDAKADKDIANEPSKRGSSLLDSLSND